MLLLKHGKSPGDLSAYKTNLFSRHRREAIRADNSVDADGLGVQMTLGSRAYRISTVMIYRTSEDSLAVLVEIKERVV